METQTIEESEQRESQGQNEEENSAFPFSKDRFLDFIERYHLGGEIERVRINVLDDVTGGEAVRTLQTVFVSDDHTVHGNVRLRDFQFEECEVGVLQTSRLKKLVNVLEEDINISLQSMGGRTNGIVFEDEFKQVRFSLAEKKLIDEVPQSPKRVPEFNIGFDLDEEFMNSFKSGIRALSSNLFRVDTTPTGELKIVLGWSNRGSSNNITFYPDTDMLDFNPNDGSPLVFRGDLYNEILNSNSGCEVRRCEISDEGLLRLHFEDEDFLNTYHVAAENFSGR